ncbi:S41 family peptidase [Pontibacter sp. H249]|uniref:S41 family peptidase n=1 Tax=Pontibacter sp. H249 TaxID=3133420 RepID=UPI0030BC1F89
MKLPLILLFFLLTNAVLAQDCDCATEFEFVKSYYEQNSPAFPKIKSDSKAHNNYQQQVKQLSKAIAKEKSEDRCILYLEQYVELLKDHHSGIGPNLKRQDIDFSNEDQMKSFKAGKTFQSFRKVPVDTLKIQAALSTKNPEDVEGIYTNSSGLNIGIIKNKKGSYIGVVLSKTRLLEVGHVLLELKKKDTSTYEGVYHLGLLGYNFQHYYKEVEVKEGRIPQFGFYKQDFVSQQHKKPYEFKEIDSQTNYIRLSSFDGGLKKELNAFYEAIADKLNSTPYLVIDLRDNGGGDEQCYYNLLPYLYTKPLVIDNADVWVSPENIKRYEELAKGTSTPLIQRMKQAQPYTFIPQVESAINTWELDSTTAYPKKVAVLFNRNTASSAEGMIMYAKQSDKVVTIGENSGGYLGYGNVMQASTPCGKYILGCTTTKYLNKSKYEYIGIEPMYKPADKQDWVTYAQSLFLNL